MKNVRITQTLTERSDDSLRAYFKEISKEPMLTPEEEKTATPDQLVRANLRFVISIAKQYQGNGIPLVDLIQSGNAGLIMASKKYTGQVKFITYAVWWIRQSIIKSICDECRTVRMPTNQIANYSKVKKVYAKYQQLYERDPSIEEIVEETGIEEDQVLSSLGVTMRSVSIDTPTQDDGCIKDTLADDVPNGGESLIDNASRKEELEKVLSQLSYRDGDVLRMLFGIGIPAMPKKEVADRFGIGEERLRQIKFKALGFIQQHYSSSLKKLL